MDAPVTSTRLLDCIRAREGEAWDRFVQLYRGWILQIARRKGLQSDDAEDIAQEVFQAVAKHIDNFKKERASDSFRGWLYRITRNKILDYISSRKKRPQTTGDADRLEQLPEEMPDELSVHSSSGDLVLKQALEMIRPEFHEQTWKAFWMFVAEERTAKEVATELGTTPENVRGAKHRIIQRLRAEFGDLIDLP